jgi:hypothetical protein
MVGYGDRTVVGAVVETTFGVQKSVEAERDPVHDYHRRCLYAWTAVRVFFTGRTPLIHNDRSVNG